MGSLRVSSVGNVNSRDTQERRNRSSRRGGSRLVAILVASILVPVCLQGQELVATVSKPSTQTVQTQPEKSQTPEERELMLLERVERLEKRIADLEAKTSGLPAGMPTETVERKEVLVNNTPAADPATRNLSAAMVNVPAPAPGQQSGTSTETGGAVDFLHDTTLNLALDGYYEYNFNYPVGRVNLLRAYDVLSNEFSLNQADVIIDHPPDLAEGRRWGGRLDLQFGQATDTLQGNPTNEPRPEIYRNIFQVYGTYIIPVGKGVTVDFGKWASSLGFEGNYTKDQINYSRSYWFNFLPFYHMGVRTAIPVNDSFTINYWVVNGTNQVEATNGFKDELFGFTAKPRKTILWTMNYYLGQDHPDRIVVAPTSPIPVQPGLSFQAISPAPNGRTHIFDSYVTWQPTTKLTFALEEDYLIERLWKNSAPGMSSTPSHTDGGAAYVQYQLTPRFTLGTRAEYMSDHGGLFSGITQALKENTVTFDYNVANGFLMRYEWRRDYSNQRTFLTDTQGGLAKQQDTATVGVIWWWGRKEGTW
jgi:Putative beta-barrel porin-2, OmpL-like. bbp2